MVDDNVADAQFILNPYTNLYVPVQVEWRNKPEKTDGDLPAFWFFGGLVVIMVALIRFMSIITGGDTPKEPAYRPKRLDKCE